MDVTDILVLVVGESGCGGVLAKSELAALACAGSAAAPEHFAVASAGEDETLLREAAAFGAGRALMLEPTRDEPTLQAAAALAEVIRAEGFGLVLLGDGDGGSGRLLGSAIAGELGWEVLVGVDSVRTENGALTIERITTGWREVVTTGPPLVATLRSAGPEMRATIEGVLAAASMHIERVPLRPGAIAWESPPFRFEAAAIARAAEPPAGESPMERLASMSGHTRASVAEPEPLEPRDAAIAIISAVRKALGR